MRETRSSGSVEGVLSNGHPYSDSSSIFQQECWRAAYPILLFLNRGAAEWRQSPRPGASVVQASCACEKAVLVAAVDDAVDDGYAAGP